MTTIENWNVFFRYSRTHDKVMPYLRGQVYGHPAPYNLDGEVLETTAIEILSEDGSVVTTTSGTEYILGMAYGPFIDDVRVKAPRLTESWDLCSLTPTILEVIEPNVEQSG